MALPRVAVTSRCFPETRALLANHAQVDANDAVEPWSYETTRPLPRRHRASRLHD